MNGTSQEFASRLLEDVVKNWFNSYRALSSRRMRSVQLDVFLISSFARLFDGKFYGSGAAAGVTPVWRRLRERSRLFAAQQIDRDERTRIICIVGKMIRA